MVLNIILAALAFLSLAITVWQWLAASRFPLHRRVADRGYTPAVTLLKPLKGQDHETRHCLESWLAHDYPGEVQILFGVGSAGDPVCETVRQLIAAHPERDAQLVVCAELLGANAKVSTLIQLQRLARHDVIIVSDADVHVPPDFLANIVAPLRDPAVGLVSCFYGLANPTTLAMQWEAIAINADFWGQVLQSQTLKPIDFALGAVMTTTRRQIEDIGGFQTLVDYLADDYQLGNRVARKGGRIEISPVVVECRESAKTWKQVWRHQLRWARTIRACQPIPFFFSILSNATLWPMLLLLLTVSRSQPLEWSKQANDAVNVGKVTVTQVNLMVTIPWTFVALLICLAVRILTAVSNRARLERTSAGSGYFWLVPLKDSLNAAIWALAFLGNRVEWRGRRYRIRRGGRLAKVDHV